MRSHYRDGSVAVLDRSQTIRVFDGQGALRWTAGGEGEGPGEFRWAQMVTEIPGDSLLVWDAASGRLTVFTLDSLLVRDAGTFTLRGEILDALTGRRIAEARVLVDSRFEALTDWRGTFRIALLPRGFAVPILVDAFKYV